MGRIIWVQEPPEEQPEGDFDWGWEELRERLPSLGLELLHWDEEWQTAILRMARGGPTIEMHLAGDAASIRYARLGVGVASDNHDARALLSKVLAVIAEGRVWDRYGYLPNGSFEWIGACVEYEEGGTICQGVFSDSRETMRFPA